MEIILLSYRLFYWVFIAPIWWVATYLASYFYPFEGDAGYLILSLIFSTIMIVCIFAAFMAWM